MKYFYLLLFLPTFCLALTLDVEIGKANIQGNTLESVAIKAHSLDSIERWQVDVSAPVLHNDNYRARDLSYESIWFWHAGDLEVGQSTLRATWAQTPFTLNVDALTLKKLLSGEIIWPRGVGMQFRGGNDVVSIKSTMNGSTAFDSYLQATLPLEMLNEWLSVLDIHLPENSKGQFRPNLDIIRTQKGWQIKGELALEDFSWQSVSAEQALEGVNMSLSLDLYSQDNSHWYGNLSGQINQGELLFSPIYLNANEVPIRWQSNIDYVGNRIKLTDLRLEDGVVNARGSLTLDRNTGELIELSADHVSGDAQKIYQRYASPYLQDSILNDASLTGTLFISGHWQDNQFSEINGVFNHVDIIDNQARFYIHNLDGQFGQMTPNYHSAFSIEEAKWQNLTIGGFNVLFDWTDTGVVLREPIFIPILNGGIEISSLKPAETNGYLLQAAILPIDLSELSATLGWPNFQGVISGEFPAVRWSKEGLKLSKPVIIQAFNGLIKVDALYVKAFFQASPIAGFNLSVDHLDIGLLTQAFNMASIQGNIEGQAQDVVLVNWKPKQFAASFSTDKETPGKRRISHEAVQYLSSAGGGSAVVGGFVEMLNEFPYEKLGFSGVLQNNILAIEGVEPYDEKSFYIVKGRGLPHLDIIGYHSLVDWPELLARLIAAAQSEGAVIE